MMYVIATSSGPYFKSSAKGLPLLAVGQTVRSWPGGTGGYKLGANYVSGFLPARAAAKDGYAQILWLLGEKITEAGAMNFFIVVKREDGGTFLLLFLFKRMTDWNLYFQDLDVITPALDGTILPGVTRDSCLALLNAHTAGRTVLPGISPSQKFHTHERDLSMSEVVSLSEQGKILESFACGTAVIVAPIGRIGWEGKDVVFPNEEEGLGVVGRGLWQRITDVQMGREVYEDWSVVC
jgi:branched-chain amino acid aminotransferase